MYILQSFSELPGCVKVGPSLFPFALHVIHESYLPVAGSVVVVYDHGKYYMLCDLNIVAHCVHSVKVRSGGKLLCACRTSPRLIPINQVDHVWVSIWPRILVDTILISFLVESPFKFRKY